MDVVARCQLQLPVVIKVPPHLDDGTPFPTLFWLTCPLAVRRIGRLEADGGVKKAESRLAADDALAAEYEAAMRRYQSERDSLIPDDWVGPRPTGGVGGTRHGVKCLHAQYADHAAGNANPVGSHTAAAIEPLNCDVPCVTDGVRVARNADWVEPKR